MKYNEQCIAIYKAVLCRSHAMSATAIAVLAVMSTDSARRWKPKDMEAALGISYMSATNAIKRLKLEAYVGASGVIEPLGLFVVGEGPAGVTNT